MAFEAAYQVSDFYAVQTVSFLRPKLAIRWVTFMRCKRFIFGVRNWQSSVWLLCDANVLLCRPKLTIKWVTFIRCKCFCFGNWTWQSCEKPIWGANVLSLGSETDNQVGDLIRCKCSPHFFYLLNVNFYW